MSDSMAVLKNKMLDEGYICLKELPTGELAGIMQYIFTFGLVVGLTEHSLRIRYCYETLREAAAALELWEGLGHPSGDWIKGKGKLIDGTQVDMQGPGALMNPNPSTMNIECGKSIAVQEALTVILKHEKIPFTVGVCHSGPVIMVEVHYVEKTNTILTQWSKAMDHIMHIIPRVD